MIEFTKANIRTWSMLGTNGSFGVACLELPRINDKTLVLTADLTYFSGLERFMERFPDRFYNLGIAEQNMMGVAAGLANEGFNVFAANYATFATTRACDQLRVCLGYMKRNVKIVGCTAGVSIGILGPTHTAVEDLAVLRAIPNITIISPSDCASTIKATLALANFEGPAYLRLTGGMSHPIVYTTDFDFEIGKGIEIKKGDDVAILATGSMVYHSLEAAKILGEEGISCSVVDMHTIKPLDRDLLTRMSNRKLLVTVEEHSIYGGLGGAVAEHLSSCTGRRPVQLIIGLQDKFEKAGDYKYLLDVNGLNALSISSRIKHKLTECLHR